MKKLGMILLSLLMVLSLLTGCDSEKQKGENSAEEIKIGINYELSDGVASYGESSVNGIMMAIDEINAAGGIDGKKIVPVKLDNKSEAGEATSLATRLMTQDKVVASDVVIRTNTLNTGEIEQKLEEHGYKVLHTMKNVK